MTAMIKWLRDHSLSLVLFGIWWTLTIAAFALPKSPFKEYVHNLSGDAFGAFLIVLATKYFIERGSAESK